MSPRLEIASRILAGFASNNAAFAANEMSGWGLVNCSDEDIAGYAVRLADKLIEAEKAIQSPAPKTDAGEQGKGGAK